MNNIPAIYEIEDLRQLVDNFPPYYERGFTKRYLVREENGLHLDTCISMHTSKTCLLFLADGHSIIKDGKLIKNIDFKVGKSDRLKNKIHGKHKRGAQLLEKNSPLAFIETTDDTRYPLYTIPSKLMDINSIILEDYSKIISDNKTTGFIAMIHPKNFRSSGDQILEGLLTPQEYEKLLEDRKTAINNG